jgi:hypothetical protein
MTAGHEDIFGSEVPLVRRHDIDHARTFLIFRARGAKVVKAATRLTLERDETGLHHGACYPEIARRR